MVNKKKAVLCKNILGLREQGIKGFVISEGKIESTIKDTSSINKMEMEVIDYGENFITPGFIDSHNHFLTTSLQLEYGIDLDSSSQINFSTLIDKIKSFSKKNTFPWIIGRGLNSSYFQEKALPDRKVLDRSGVDKPIFLIHQSGHAAVCNSLALIEAGLLSKDIVDPIGGRIGRYSDGSPNGILYEKAAMDLVRAKIPKYTKADYKRAMIDIQKKYILSGLTCVKDTGGNGFPIDELSRIEALNEMDSAGELLIRIGISIPIFSFNEVDSKVDLSKKIIQTEKLFFAGFKLFLDGSGLNKTAWMKEPWLPNDTAKNEGDRGIVRMELDDFKAIIKKLCSIDTVISIHAVGDAAVAYVLSTIREVKEMGCKARFTIVHAYIPTKEDLMIMKKYDVSVETQTSFLWLLGEQIIKNLGSSRAKRLFPIKDYLSNGINVCLTSDSPVSNFDPVLSIFSSTRRAVKTETGIVIHNEEQRISLVDSVKCLTENPAKVLGKKEIGSLEVGAFADFIVWPKSFTEIPQNDCYPRITPMAVYISGVNIFKELEGE
ncbi:MAG: amidohydrolase family protein [Conexivisphaerales archaeon]